jgi:hypothetical protein
MPDRRIPVDHVCPNYVCPDLVPGRERRVIVWAEPVAAVRFRPARLATVHLYATPNEGERQRGGAHDAVARER